jgi:hypothetical protein
LSKNFWKGCFYYFKIATLAPDFRKALAVSKPMPEAPAVTITFDFFVIICVLFQYERINGDIKYHNTVTGVSKSEKCF